MNNNEDMLMTGVDVGSECCDDDLLLSAALATTQRQPPAGSSLVVSSILVSTPHNCFINSHDPPRRFPRMASKPAFWWLWRRQARRPRAAYDNCGKRSAVDAVASPP